MSKELELGNQYYYGEGVALDLKLAAEHYAASETAEAKCYLGYMYREGIGVEQNLQKAFELFLEAASSFPMAEYNLGLMYEKGLFVEQSPEKAAEYFALAKMHGYTE